MVPDKIYVGIQDLGTGYTYALSLDNNGEQEYIRKDALLEWLDGKMTIEGATEGFVGGYDTALKEVIDHINKI